MKRKSRHGVLPGFKLTLSITLAFLAAVVVVPLSTLFVKSATLGVDEFWRTILSARTLAALELSFGASLVAAAANALFGLAVAWTLVRYEFPGRALVDAVVDLPFALPTAVAGITLTALCAQDGWVGRVLAPLGVRVAFAPAGVVVALIFVGLPFVVRTVEAVLQDLDPELEEAAVTLGAGRANTFARITMPSLVPPLLTGFALAFARALGEYGSVVFISGNLPMRTEVAPLLIMAKLEEFDYAGATAIALVTLAASCAILLAVNLLRRWSTRRLFV